MTERALHEKRIGELDGYIGLDDDSKVIAIQVETLREWALAIVKDCCPEKAPDGLGASPSRCDVCEFLMERFGLKEKDLK